MRDWNISTTTCSYTPYVCVRIVNGKVHSFTFFLLLSYLICMETFRYPFITKLNFMLNKILISKYSSQVNVAQNKSTIFPSEM